MIAWILFAVLLVVAIVGALLKYHVRASFPLHREVAVLGAYSLGLLVVWFPATLFRGLLIGIYAENVTLLEGMMWCVPFFFAELLILLGLLVRQCLFLKGDYDADSEWKPSADEGGHSIARILIISCILFVACWWLIRPGEFGTYRGSIGDTLVLDSVATKLSTEISSLEIEAIQNKQNAMAIPAAMAISNVLALLSFLILPAYRFIKRELSGNYLYETRIPGGARQFGPRGGGRN